MYDELAGGKQICRNTKSNEYQSCGFFFDLERRSFPFPFLLYKIVVHHICRENFPSKLFVIANYCRPIFIHFVAAVSMPGANLGLPSKRKIINRNRLARTGSLFNLADGRSWHQSSQLHARISLNLKIAKKGPAMAIRNLGTTNGLLDFRQFQ